MSPRKQEHGGHRLVELQGHPLDLDLDQLIYHPGAADEARWNRGCYLVVSFRIADCNMIFFLVPEHGRAVTVLLC